MTPTPTRRDWQLLVDHDVQLAGEDTGTGFPAVVLLHGLASTRRWWDLVTARLAARHRVIRFDHRGHGASAAPPDGYTIEQLAADTIDVLDRFDLTAVVLAGHSLGATIALAVAATRPDLAAAVACIDGGIYDPMLLFGPTWAQAHQAMLHHRSGHTTIEVLKTWLASTDLSDDLLPVITANYASPAGQLRLRLTAEHEQQLAHSLWDYNLARSLAAVRCPVHVIAAEQGNPHHDRPRRLSICQARSLLGPLLQVWSVRGGHDLPLEQPNVVAAAIAGLAATATSSQPGRRLTTAGTTRQT